MVARLSAPKSCGLPIAADIIPEIQEWIDDVGIEEAFKIVGTILLYSGPRDTIAKACKKISGKNHAKIKELLKKKPASISYTLLDKTDAGLKLEEYGGKGLSLYTYLQIIYEEKYRKIIGPSFNVEDEDAAHKLASKEADGVMEYVSKKFIEAAYGDVETCVCGADFDRVFYKVELPALMNNPRITAINGVDINEFKKIYSSGKERATYETFTLICKSELDFIQNRAASAPVDKTDYYTNDYETRGKFFELEQEESANKFREEVLARLISTKNLLMSLDPARPAAPAKVVHSKKPSGPS